MIVNKQKPINIINKCKCVLDKEELKKAILWYTDKPVVKNKTVYIHAKYPTVSIHDKKIHIHRLLMSYWNKKVLDSREYIHHIDGNKLNVLKENLSITTPSQHQSYHNKGKIITEKHKEGIRKANRKRRGTTHKRKYDIEFRELKSFLFNGWSINKIAKYYGCDWSVIKQRIYENPELLEAK
jgi:hypothetical protein